MHRALVLTLGLTFTSACGLVGDGAQRQGALGHDDVIQTGGGADEGAPAEICEYPPMLTSGSHAIDLRDCLKLEGGQLGDDLELDVNGREVVISDWIHKDGEGDYIGFHVDGDVIVVVKAGTDLFEATGGTWVHPGGTSGPNAKGISFVAFCEPPTDDPECRPVDGGDPGDGGSGGGTPGTSGGDDPGTSGGGSGDPDDGYCDPYTCEPGGQLGGSDGDDGDSGGSGDGGSSGSGDGSSGDGSSGDGSPTGGSSSGGSATCANSVCGTDNSCGTNQACFGGCCLDVIL